MSDGGIIHIDYLGERFLDCSIENSDRKRGPLLIILPTLTGFSQTPYILLLAIEARKLGYDVCIPNWRGQAGAEYVTPKIYTLMSYEDAEEPMRYIVNKYGQNSQVFVVGCSMGANILGHVLANEGINNTSVIDAAVIIQAPMNLTEC